MAHHRELCISGTESSSVDVGAIGHGYREERIWKWREKWEEIAAIHRLLGRFGKANSVVLCASD